MFLPTESLVPFKAQRLANAYTGYVNHDCKLDISWLDRFAYLIPSELNDADQFLSMHKVFFAERYGGARIVTHGGGVRCGLDGDFSVKGIGCNPLLGRDAKERNFSHSHGGLSLAGAIQDAIWGNVFYSVLPYGAVRTVSLIVTSTQCRDHNKALVPAALAVREAALRPAHFERAVYFRPQTGLVLVDDVERVKAAIRHLPSVLPLPENISGDELEGVHPLEKLKLGMFEMTRRFAAQAAAAHSRRLTHGAITASNIGLDGRWLDFGSSEARSTYANAQFFRFFPTLWEEYLVFAPLINEFCFYIRKYFPVEEKYNLPQASHLLQVFSVHYHRWLKHAFIRLTGFPEPLLASHWKMPEVEQFAEQLIQIARLGVEKPFISPVADLERYGPNRLGELLPTIACWYDHAGCINRLSSLVPILEQRIAVIDTYRVIADVLYKQASLLGVGSQALRRLSVLNAAKCSKNIEPLQSGYFVKSKELNDICLPEDIQSFIDGVSFEAEVIYQPSASFVTLMWKSSKVQVFYDALRDHWHIKECGRSFTLPWQAVDNSETLSAMNAYWGHELWFMLSERSKLDNAVYEGVEGYVEE